VIRLAVLSASVLAMAWVPGAQSTPWPLLGLWIAAFAAYGLAARSVRDLSPRAIWVGAIALRMGLLGAAPSLSEDVYRYIWDGWVARNGVNTFAFAPAATELTGLRTEWWELINHPGIPTIYPPGAQIVFLVLAWIAPAWLLFKIAWVAADLVVALLIGRLCGAPGPDRAPANAISGLTGVAPLLPVFLYLWNPLVLIEVAWSGHFEPVGIALMLSAVLVVRSRAWLGGVLLGLGAAIKFAPLAAVPALFRRYGMLAAVLAVLTPGILYLPFLDAGSRLFEGLRTYADIWEFNAGLYWVMKVLPGPAELGRWLGAATVAGVALFAGYRRVGLGTALYWTVGAGLLVSPTIHPWYVLWVLPFASLYRARAWILLTGTVFLAYGGRDAYLATGVWPEPVWLRLLIHGPVLALLAWDWRKSSREEGADPPAA